MCPKEDQTNLRENIQNLKQDQKDASVTVCLNMVRQLVGESAACREYTRTQYHRQCNTNTSQSTIPACIHQYA